MKVFSRLAAVLLFTAALTACSQVPGIVVYEKNGQAPAGATAADAVSFVDANWSQKIVPTVQEKAVDVVTVAAAIDEDPEAAGRQYGNQAGAGSPYAYMVTGSGTITKVDTSAPTGPVTVEVPGIGGEPLTVTVATGPVIAGTAIRDAVGFISFGDFTNQIEYANVASQINEKVKTEVVAGKELKQGEKLTFHGAFPALPGGAILVVPTALEVG